LGTERLGEAARLDSDDQFEAACACCRKAGRSCREGRRLLGRNAEHLAGSEQNVGSGFAGSRFAMIVLPSTLCSIK
jgi:hypothetical protein